MNIRGHGHVRVAPLEATDHHFSVGQTVRIKGRSGSFPNPDEIFRITRTLPTQDNYPQYRVRSEGESYERVAPEDALELVETEPVGRARKAPGGGTGATDPKDPMIGASKPKHARAKAKTPK